MDREAPVASVHVLNSNKSKQHIVHVPVLRHQEKNM